MNNRIVIATGRKGSGKSHLIHRHFTSKAKRVIHLDFVGEIKKKIPTAVETIGLAATMEAIREMARQRKMEWNIVAVFPESEMWGLPRLCAQLVPTYGGEKAPIGIAKAFGGIALECTECDILLPIQGGAWSSSARSMMRRARHESLDLFLATQRPQDCHKLCTSMADFVISFKTTEPRELKYLRDGVGTSFALRVRDLSYRHSLWFRKDDELTVEIDADGNAVISDYEDEGEPDERELDGG